MVDSVVFLLIALKSVTDDCAATGVVTSTNVAYASTYLSCDYSYATSNSVTTHVNEAYSKHLKKEGDSAKYSSPGDSYEMDKNPTYGMQHKTTSIGGDAVVTTANQAYGSFKNMVYDSASSAYVTADTVYEDCQEYSYVKT